MKHDWEYKKLGDICDKGSSNISLNKIEDNIGEYALFGASGYVKDIDFYHNETPYIGIVKDGSGCGRVNIYPAKSSLVGTMQYIYPKQNCDIKFLMYLLQSLDLSSLVTGAAIPHIYFKDYSKFSIPVPPLPTQQSIVSELDSLSKIIADCKETLKDYDALEQSIFYDMFGDPVKNDKGWDVKKLGEVTKIVTGNTPSRSVKEYYNSNFIEWIKTDNIERGVLYPSMAEEFLSEKGAEKGRIVEKDCILMACIAGSLSSLGKSCITRCQTAFNQQINAVIPNKIITDTLFLYMLFNIASNYIQSFATSGMKHIITKGILEQIPFFIPPLPLQQQFASKIEAIENMKSETKKALQEAETLFNARMDYWFD